MSNPNGDKLILCGMKFHGYHGVHEEERKLGQKFVVDADVWTDLAKAGASDKLEDSISYAVIYKYGSVPAFNSMNPKPGYACNRIIKGIVEGPPRALLESVAASIAEAVFQEFALVSSIRVRIGKPHVAVEGIVDYLGVEIYRTNPCSMN